jgi:hypothetical protein
VCESTLGLSFSATLSYPVSIYAVQSLLYLAQNRKYLFFHSWDIPAEAITDSPLFRCTGCFLLAESGVLKGKRASGPRALVGDLRKRFPGTEWIDGKRWVSDGNVWSSGELAALS